MKTHIIKILIINSFTTAQGDFDLPRCSAKSGPSSKV